MKTIIHLPIWIVLADLLYGFVLNIASGLNLWQTTGQSLAPEIAFNGLQILVNGGMVLILGWSLWVLWRLHRSVNCQQIMPFTTWTILALLVIGAFSLPAWWEWFGVLLALLDGRWTVSWHNPRYLVVACCQPLLALILLHNLWQRWHLIKQTQTQPNKQYD